MLFLFLSGTFANIECVRRAIYAHCFMLIFFSLNAYEKPTTNLPKRINVCIGKSNARSKRGKNN